MKIEIFSIFFKVSKVLNEKNSNFNFHANQKLTLFREFYRQANSDYTDDASTGGYYSICIDNQFSRFAGKLVNLYITVVKYDDWEKFTKEIEDLNVNMNNFTQVVQTVEGNLNMM